MSKTIIIAEAGVNHNGNIDLARQMIDVAKEAGSDIIKFQSYKTHSLVSKNAEKADYQKKYGDPIESQYEMLKKLEINRQDHEILLTHCNKMDIEFMSTPFDISSLELLHQLGVKRFKISSGDLTNYPLLKATSKYKKPVILSTGMAYLGEVEQALIVLCENGLNRDDITLMHCNTEYPTPFKDANLKAIQTLKSSFGGPVGYSDHTPGIEASIAALAFGAMMIEKHFTLDKNSIGPDHQASLTAEELHRLVESIRNVELAIGDGLKQPTNSEKKNISIARKSIVAIRAIQIGEMFTEQNISVKRPGTGISPMLWENIVGRKSNRNYSEDDLIEL